VHLEFDRQQLAKKPLGDRLSRRSLQLLAWHWVGLSVGKIISKTNLF
jgi:hypothetical protein